MSAPIDQPDYTTPTLLASSDQTVAGQVIADNTETPLLTIPGTGKLVETHLEFVTAVVPAALVYYWLFIYADGNLAYAIDNMQITQSVVATSGRTGHAEFMQDAASTHMWVRIPIEFRTSLEIRALQRTGAAVFTVARATVSLIR